MSSRPMARAIAAAGGRCWGGCSGVASRHRALAWCTAACVACVMLAVVVPVALVAAHVYRDYSHLPDPGPFERFEFPAIGHVYVRTGSRSFSSLANTDRSPADDIPCGGARGDSRNRRPAFLRP